MMVLGDSWQVRGMFVHLQGSGLKFGKDWCWVWAGQGWTVKIHDPEIERQVLESFERPTWKRTLNND